jgi:hypothetical protein
MTATARQALLRLRSAPLGVFPKQSADKALGAAGSVGMADTLFDQIFATVPSSTMMPVAPQLTTSTDALAPTSSGIVDILDGRAETGRGADLSAFLNMNVSPLIAQQQHSLRVTTSNVAGPAPMDDSKLHSIDLFEDERPKLKRKFPTEAWR